MEKPEKGLTGVKKRQQILTANRVMFGWIVAASIVIGVCAILMQFLIRQLMFNGTVLSKLNETNQTIEGNVKAYDGLKASVVKLTANSNLTGLKKGDNSTALQVIIDALPTEDNRTALATSMQKEVIGPSGVVLDSFVAQSSDVAGYANTTSSLTAGAQSFDFTFSIVGTYDQVKQAIRNIERSIRPINIKTLDIVGTDQRLQATITATTYYQLPKTVELGKKTIKP